MNLRDTAVAVFLGIGLLLPTSSTRAATLNTSGIWSGATGNTTFTGEESSQLFWGETSTFDTTGEQSSYVFDGVVETVNINDLVNNSFLLGEFTHNNRPITATGGFLTSATLDVALNIETFSQIFSFHFVHNETINLGIDGICPAGGVEPCPDVVSFPDSVAEQFITLDDVEYTLTLVGFSQDGGTTLVDEFLTLEQASNTAGLYAGLTALEMPEPSPPEELPPPGELVTPAPSEPPTPDEPPLPPPPDELPPPDAPAPPAPPDAPAPPDVVAPPNTTVPEPAGVIGLICFGVLVAGLKRRK